MKVLWLVTTMPCVSHQDHLPLWVQGGVEVSTNDCPPPHDCPPPPPSPEVEFIFLKVAFVLRVVLSYMRQV